MKTLFPLVTTDIALFTLMDFQLRVLLVKRGNDPSPGAWALPGGILQPDLDRSLEDSARRVLAQKVNVEIPHLAQVATVSGPDRDPRGWSISTLYYALLPSDQADATIGDAVDEVAWSDPENHPHLLAFDHALLLQMALSTLRWKVAHGALPLHQLPAKFSLTDR